MYSKQEEYSLWPDKNSAVVGQLPSSPAPSLPVKTVWFCQWQEGLPFTVRCTSSSAVGVSWFAGKRKIAKTWQLRTEM